MPRKNKVHAMDDMWKMTQEVHWLGYQHDDQKRELLSETIQSLIDTDLTIKQIHILAEIIYESYEIGKKDGNQ